MHPNGLFAEALCTVSGLMMARVHAAPRDTALLYEQYFKEAGEAGICPSLAQRVLLNAALHTSVTLASDLAAVQEVEPDAKIRDIGLVHAEWSARVADQA